MTRRIINNNGMSGVGPISDRFEIALEFRTCSSFIIAAIYWPMGARAGGRAPN